MPTEDSSSSTTGGTRRTPTNALSPQELRAAERTQRIPAWKRGGIVTGEIVMPDDAGKRGAAKISASMGKPRSRPAPRNEEPYYWWEALGSFLVLYGTFIGIPAGWGIWAAVKIWRMTRHGW